MSGSEDVTAHYDVAIHRKHRVDPSVIRFVLEYEQTNPGVIDRSVLKMAQSLMGISQMFLVSVPGDCHCANCKWLRSIVVEEPEDEVDTECVHGSLSRECRLCRAYAGIYDNCIHFGCPSCGAEPGQKCRPKRIPKDKPRNKFCLTPHTDRRMRAT